MGNIIRIAFFLLLTNLSFGQIKFYNLYTDNGVDLGEGIVQLEDSSYVVTGSSSSFWGGASQAFLMKIDSLGNYVWSNQYGGIEYESSRRVLYKKNVGFYMCGFTSSMGNGGFDFYLAKTDESGTLEWEKTIGGPGWEKVNDAIMTADTGAILVGETTSFPENNKNIYIVRTNKDGDTLWTKTIGGSGEDYATSITKLDDSLYFLTGSYYNEDSLMSKAWAAKIQDNGRVFWEKNYGVVGPSWINGAVYDGALMQCVGGSDVNGSDLDAFNCVIDTGGGYWGEYVAPSTGDYENYGIAQYGPLNEFYTTTSVDDAGSFPIGVDLVVHKFTSGYSFVNSFGLSHDKDDIANHIIPTSDGSAIIVGYTTGVISGGNEIFVCKVGPNSDYPDVINDLQVGNVVTVIEEELNDKIHVYPNPSNGVVNVKTDNPIFNELVIYSVQGERILTQKFSFEEQVDFSTLTNGYYYLELRGRGVVRRRKVIVQH